MQIETRRFMLRDFVEADRAAFLAYQADARGRAFYGPDEARPEHGAWLFDTFRRWADERPRLNVQLAVMERAAPHALVGCCGLRLDPEVPGRADFGLELAPDVWGRYGYAIEIARAVIEAGFGEMRLAEITGSTVSANDRVQRLARWFGAEVAWERDGPPWMQARGWREVGWRISAQRWGPIAARVGGVSSGRIGAHPRGALAASPPVTTPGTCPPTGRRG